MGGRGGWGLSPAGWLFAVAAAGVELAGVAGLWRPLGTLGSVHVPASAVPATLLLAAFGPRLFAGAGRWLPFLAGAAVAGAVPAWWYRDLFGGADGLAGFAVAAVHEEVVFRAALPLLVAALARRAGADPWWSAAAGLVVPAAVFAVLPGHLQQAAGVLELLPFFTFALFFGLLVRGPGAVLPAAMAHLTVNLLTVPVTAGFVGPGARGVAVAAVLGGFALTAVLTDGDGEGVPAPRPSPVSGCAGGAGEERGAGPAAEGRYG